MKETTEGWKGESNEELHNFHALPNIITMGKSRE
jgi:hypothetical protein